MSIFNVVFLKKFLFSAGVLGLSSIPIILLNKRGLFPEAHLADIVRRTIENPSEIYAKGLGQSELLEEIIGSDELGDTVLEIFAKDIAHGHMKSHRPEDLRGLAEEERGMFEAKRANANGKRELQRILDTGGGTPHSLQRRNLSDKSYELLKAEFLNFGRRNFLLKRNLSEEEQKANKNPYAFSREDMDKVENWDKIGFHHPEDGEDSKLPKEFYEEKFKIINWAYRKWYMETRPFYAWMSLWKHMEKAPKGGLEKLYDKSKIKENFPTKPSYEFPLFSSSDDSSLSSLTKFKSFFKDVVSANGDKKDLFVSRSYTDDSATSIFVEGSSMYKSLYIKFAAAANRQYSKVLENLNSPSSSKASPSGTKTLATRDKSHSVESYKQPYELFLFGESDSSSTNFSTIKIDQILKDQAQNNKKIADAVEIKDTPWIFIRNQAGIHAVAVDSHSISKYKPKDPTLEDVFRHFNYRSLQLIHKEDLKITNTLDASPDAFIKSFKDYLEKNFPRLILGYLYEEVKDHNKLFGHGVDPNIVSFKTVYEKLRELEDMRRRYKWRMEMRGAIISEYSRGEWDIDGTSNKFKSASPKYGLAAPLPYSLNTEKQTKQEEDFILFKDLENLRDFDFFKPNGTKKHIAKYLKEISQIKDEIKKYVNGLKLTLSPVSLDSERVFTDNYFANRMVDALLSKPEALNQILFSRYLSTDYVGKFLSKNILGDKKILGDDLRLSISNDLKDDGTTDEVLSDFDLIETHNTENIKKIYGGLEGMFRRYYYPSPLLRKIPQNPWDIAKYGGDILDKNLSNNGNLASTFHRNSASAFDHSFLLNLKDTRKNYFKFLNALIYLTRDKFGGFRKLMSSRIGPFADAWWLTVKDNSSTDPKPSSAYLSNPYLNPNFDTNQVQKKVTDWSDFLRAQFFGEHLGFYIHGSPSDSTATVVDPSSSKFILQNLHKFGKDANKMAEFVDRISSESELEKVIAQIKNAVKNDTNPGTTDWLSTLDLKQIYVKDNGNSTIYRSLTLRERQNLVMAFLKKVNVEITNQTIEKTKYKNIFLADPNNNYNLTIDKHNGGSDEKIKNDLFSSKEIQIKINDQTTYTSKPINSSSFSTEEEFKTFVKTCKKWGFWSWIISFAMREDVQEMALRDLQDSSDKIDPYDPKWREVLNSRFLK